MSRKKSASLRKFQKTFPNPTTEELESTSTPYFVKTAERTNKQKKDPVVTRGMTGRWMGALATGTATRSSSTAGLWAIMPSSDDEEEAISKMPAKMVKDPKLAAEANKLEPKRERESHIYIYISRDIPARFCLIQTKQRMMQQRQTC